MSMVINDSAIWYGELGWRFFESAAKESLPGVVFTWAYSHPDMNPLLQMLLKTIEPYDVTVHYVHVHCSQAELERRVVAEERKLADKACTVEALHRIQGFKNHQVIPDSNSLIIDSTHLPPTEAARKIVTTFGLE